MNKLEDIGKRLAVAQARFPSAFIMVLLFIIAATLPGIPLLLENVEPSLEKILPQRVMEVQTMNDMRGQFGADMMYIVVRSRGPSQDVRDPDVVKYLDVLSEKLRKNEYILEVTSIADFVKEANSGVIPESNKKIRMLLNLNPRSALFINHDYSLTFIQVRSDTGANAQIVRTVVKQMKRDILSLQKFNPGVELSITGFNAIDKATFEVIITDFVYITGISFALMIAFMLAYFRDWRKVAGSVSVIAVSVLVTLGITGYLGITITVVTMVAAAMIMALGISYGINVTYEYYSLRNRFEARIALKKMNARLIRALVGSSLTTSAGFLALLFGIIPAMKNLGVILAMGITITLVVSIVFLPAITFLFDKNKNKIKNARR